MGTAEKNTWTEPPASEFMVRGPNYLKQTGTNVVSLKQPSAEAPYACVGMNVFKSPVSTLHSAQKIQVSKQFLDEQPGDEDLDGLPSFLVICWFFSNFFGTEHTIVQHIFRRTAKPRGEDPHLDAAVKRFMAADDHGKNEQLKYMFKIVDGPSVLKTTVATLGGERPVLIGRRLTTSYFRGRNYLEVGE